MPAFPIKNTCWKTCTGLFWSRESIKQTQLSQKAVLNLLSMSLNCLSMIPCLTIKLRGESHIDFLYAKHPNHTGGVKEEVSLMTFWNSKKLSNFKAHELSWTVNELCARIPRVPSLCPPIAHMHRWTLWKNHLSAVFSSKMQHKRQSNGN